MLKLLIHLSATKSVIGKSASNGHINAETVAKKRLNSRSAGRHNKCRKERNCSWRKTRSKKNSQLVFFFRREATRTASVLHGLDLSAGVEMADSVF